MSDDRGDRARQAAAVHDVAFLNNAPRMIAASAVTARIGHGGVFQYHQAFVKKALEFLEA